MCHNQTTMVDKDLPEPAYSFVQRALHIEEHDEERWINDGRVEMEKEENRHQVAKQKETRYLQTS
jgi:hypothetical protein